MLNKIPPKAILSNDMTGCTLLDLQQVFELLNNNIYEHVLYYISYCSKKTNFTFTKPSCCVTLQDVYIYIYTHKTSNLMAYMTSYNKSHGQE